MNHYELSGFSKQISLQSDKGYNMNTPANTELLNRIFGKQYDFKKPMFQETFEPTTKATNGDVTFNPKPVTIDFHINK